MHRLRVLAAALAASALVAQTSSHANTETYSTGVGTDYPKQVFFGDLICTQISPQTLNRWAICC